MIDKLLETWKPGDPLALHGSFSIDDLRAILTIMFRRIDLPPKTCENQHCETTFFPSRRDQRYCSDPCRTRQANREAYARSKRLHIPRKRKSRQKEKLPQLHT